MFYATLHCERPPLQLGSLTLLYHSITSGSLDTTRRVRHSFRALALPAAVDAIPLLHHQVLLPVALCKLGWLARASHSHVTLPRAHAMQHFHGLYTYICPVAPLRTNRPFHGLHKSPSCSRDMRHQLEALQGPRSTLPLHHLCIGHRHRTHCLLRDLRRGSPQLDTIVSPGLHAHIYAAGDVCRTQSRRERKARRLRPDTQILAIVIDRAEGTHLDTGGHFLLFLK
ncbi:hypothetical protein FB451DRAFT_1485100 [Mycena latifolia]|nr:hypothetical protein FB451DRAFT_1485100 [Mycena latifolia]